MLNDVVPSVWNTDAMSTYKQRPWLLDLATEQRGEAGRIQGIYDRKRQMRVFPGTAGTPVIASGAMTMTKKADRESGEDQKDRW
jgi:hypothetical protein